MILFTVRRNLYHFPGFAGKKKQLCFLFVSLFVGLCFSLQVVVEGHAVSEMP